MDKFSTETAKAVILRFGKVFERAWGVCTVVYRLNRVRRDSDHHAALLYLTLKTLCLLAHSVLLMSIHWVQKHSRNSLAVENVKGMHLRRNEPMQTPQAVHDSIETNSTSKRHKADIIMHLPPPPPLPCSRFYHSIDQYSRKPATLWLTQQL